MPIFPALAFQNPTMRRTLLLLFLPVLSGCDQLADRLGMPAPAKVQAEGEAVGGACRHAGRGLEDCYRLNPRADKAAVYEGWKEMNEYMAKNNMQAVPPSLGKKPEPDEEPAEEEEEDQDPDGKARGDSYGKAGAHDEKAKPSEQPVKEAKPEHGDAAKGGH